MAFDVFISYAWTSDEHREWVRLLAAHLHNLGFNVGIDADVNYGDTLNGFMREIKSSRHVLMIIDENYVKRAEMVDDSGVAFENRVISEAFIAGKPKGWVAPLLVRNDSMRMPDWVRQNNLKYFNFQSNCQVNDFPGSEQVDDLWRWIADLPADKNHAVSLATLRKRAQRLELVELRKDTSNWSYPETAGNNESFDFCNAPHNVAYLGGADYHFQLKVTKADEKSVHVYNEGMKSISLLPFNNIDNLTIEDICDYLQKSSGISADNITPREGQLFLLMNELGCICVVQLLGVINEDNNESITFNYRIMVED